MIMLTRNRYHNKMFSKMLRGMTRAVPTIAVAAILVAAPVRAGDGNPLQKPSDSLTAAMAARSESVPVIDSTYTLDDYLTLALKRSPALKSAFYNWQAGVERSGYAGALPDPRLTYGNFIENVETRVGPQNQRFGVKQSFPWFGTLGARKDRATASANAAFQKFESERLRLRYRVKAAYYDYYFLAQDISITGANLELMTFWEAIARTKYKAALKPHPDVIRTQVELGKLEDRLFTLEDMLEPTAARLRAAVNLPAAVAIPIPAGIEVLELELNEPVVIDAVRKNNPDLRSMEQIIAREEAGVRLARKAALPSFTMGVDYIETGPALNPIMSESGKDPWMVGVTVSLPIWFGKNKARRQEAIARQQQAELSLVEAENQLEAYAARVLFEHDDALRKLRLYRDGLVPKAEQSLDASYAAYQSGGLDFLNVLDAQRQLLEFQRQYERAMADLGIRQAELETITGKPISELAY